MARPRKTRLDYFPFDVGFFENEKVACIAGEFGIKGEIVAIRLLCAVYQNGYFLEWNDAYKMKTLRQTPGISSELFDQILNRLVRWGFFDASLFDSVKVLTSVGIQRRYFEAMKFRVLDSNLPYLLIPDLLKNYAKNEFPKQKPQFSVGKTPVSQAKNPQIKLNKRENKFSPPPITPQGNPVVVVVGFEEKKRNLLSEFFAKKVSLDGFCSANRTNLEELRRLADEILDDWNLNNETDFSARHLLNSIRVKLQMKKQNQNTYGTDNRTDFQGTGGARGGYRSKLPPEPGCGLIE